VFIQAVWRQTRQHSLQTGRSSLLLRSMLKGG
jgi:hypothetical protein